MPVLAISNGIFLAEIKTNIKRFYIARLEAINLISTRGFSEVKCFISARK